MIAAFDVGVGNNALWWLEGWVVKVRICKIEGIHCWLLCMGGVQTTNDPRKKERSNNP